MGPSNTPYKGGIFELKIRIQENYPISAPHIEFITEIKHLNIIK